MQHLSESKYKKLHQTPPLNSKLHELWLVIHDGIPTGVLAGSINKLSFYCILKALSECTWFLELQWIPDLFKRLGV